MGRRVLLLVLVFSSTFLTDSFGQISSYSQQVQNEIRNRGLDEEQFRALLSEKNIDLDNLENLTSEQILELQRALDELEQLTKPGKVLSSPNDTLVPEASDAPVEVDSGEESSDSIALEAIIDTIPSDEIFGHHIFKTGQIGLIRPQQAFNPPADYRLGAGDILAVSIYGNSQMDASYTVRPDGSIIIRDGKVRVFVRGLRLSEVRDKLERNFRNDYSFRSSEFNVSVSSVRNINIRVIGEVSVQGNYTVSALNSVFNLISAAQGLTKFGSVRNIQLIKKDGKTETFDIYQFLTDPNNQSSFFLEDGDVIFVPTAGKVVRIDGAVIRPYRYELKDDEQLFELIKFAGGLKRDAYLTTLKITRYESDRKILKDVPYAANVKTRKNYALLNGDEVRVDFIRDELENYVSVTGEVRNEGNFERLRNMTLRDLVIQAGLRPTSKTDLAIIRRTNTDGSINMISVSLDDAMIATSPADNPLLDDRDELIVWAKERFIDNKYIKVAGAVRFPDKFSFDESGSLRASDVLTMAGGLSREAASYAHIHRLDPLNPGELQYVRLDLFKVLNDPNSADNLLLEPFDSIHVYSRIEFYDDLTISVSGAVKNPGEFTFGTGMSLKDAIVLAGGFRRSAATNDIEVSRVIIKDNLPTKTTIEKISVDRNKMTDFGNNEGNYILEPFDNVFVRYVPEFELQQNVLLRGEVILPGEYSLIRDNESVYDLVQRAKGLTQEAFASGATLFRNEDSLGYIVMRLDEVLLDANSRYNYSLKNGDVITIPKKQDFVTIVGATQADRVQGPNVGKGNSITVAFHQGKNALYYIINHAGGFADNARRDKIYVRYPNGEVKTTEKRFPFGRKHPEVLPGSVISVGEKKLELTSNQNKEDVNWTKVLGDSVAQAMSILTLILLIQRLD